MGQKANDGYKNSLSKLFGSELFMATWHIAEVGQTNDCQDASRVV